MKKYISGYKVIEANRAGDKKKEKKKRKSKRRSDIERGGIKMSGHMGGALRNIYILDFCLMISLPAFHPAKAVVIYQRQHER